MPATEKILHKSFDITQIIDTLTTLAGAKHRSGNAVKVTKQNIEPQKHAMKVHRLLTLAALAASTLTLSVARAADKPGDIVAVASGAGSFKTLVTAVKAAGLVETLQGKGPFTVFAPTDEAFAKLPAGTVESLLKPENKEKLKGILLYHVVPGKVMAADVKTMMAKTAGGKELSIKVEGGSVMVDNAKVVKTDVAASNGVIHIIDTVVLPK
jgi:uncharacterized surface protein with fasciclin (FAS1) repeats